MKTGITFLGYNRSIEQDKAECITFPLEQVFSITMEKGVGYGVTAMLVRAWDGTIYDTQGPIEFCSI